MVGQVTKMLYFPVHPYGVVVFLVGILNSLIS
ncbi:hypothetical protein ACJIZ3_000514 [Penstemon smallii]|uniref:Uncharacterized protein n=1 Tax=Penstemon smallii TaxID=265156 RepID=A0ABD3R253_9LAMI